MRENRLLCMSFFISVVFLIALLFAAIPVREVIAQEDLPSGSYTTSCKDCFVNNGGDLRCKNCNKKGKGTRDSSLSCFRLCQGDIRNDDGWLKCNSRGSFWKTCSSVSCTSGHLRATCNQKKKGTLYNGDFDYNSCAGDINNCDGSLTCGSCP